jgi:hypothetical protein
MEYNCKENSKPKLYSPKQKSKNSKKIQKKIISQKCVLTYEALSSNSI